MQARREVADGLTPATALDAGWAALSDGDWERARAAFEESLAEGETPQALEGLGWAAHMLDEDRVTLDVRERAYRLYLDGGDKGSAARIAAWLALDCLLFRGEPAVANGWLQRAHSLIDRLETGVDHGWLAIHEGHIAVVLGEDTAKARRLAARAVELGRKFNAPELEMLGLGLEGRALVSEGELEEGMRRLDEATTVALQGEARLLYCVAWACCYLISACERVRDFERAAQWCARVGEFCSQHDIFLLNTCRAHYASVLSWQGRWDEAESQLRAAVEGLRASRPPMVGDALARLGELRRRQGRLAEAEELFARSETHSLSLLGRAALALDRDQPAEAAELADRYLRRFPDRGRIERGVGLEVAIRALARLGEYEHAAEALEELREIAARARTRPLAAAVYSAEGTLAAAHGDHDAARRSFEDALDLLVASDARFEAARVRVDLASALSASGRDDRARHEIEAALAGFQELGAQGESARAEAMLGKLRRARAALPPDVADTPLGELSGRELEVLSLVAEGLTNHAIARRLVLSEHTVNRHVANILRKLGLPSRAAAASLAGRHGLA
ncbi:MAG TPA: LuxR C-terminal-related transcriptional regulator [Gaiellaceae bacterium]|nr:LuxR C-terminal-related transcriptional regulator [Gaiellaceae bacterium]